MSAYYFEGNNIDWFICLCLFLVVICVVNALAMFVIPEKFSLQVSRGKTLACSALIGGVLLLRLLCSPVSHSRWMNWMSGDTGKMTVNFWK